MNDVQILTLAMAVVVPVSVLIDSNSRITDVRAALESSPRSTIAQKRCGLRRMPTIPKSWGAFKASCASSKRLENGKSYSAVGSGFFSSFFSSFLGSGLGRGFLGNMAGRMAVL